MASNTKLTKEQKQLRKSMLAEMPTVKVINNGQTTIAYRELGNTIEFALSVMSPDETRFRRKVGEYWALARFDYGQTVKMNWVDFRIMCADVYNIFN